MVDMALVTREGHEPTELATRLENEALLGSIDVTPTFSVDLPGGLASAFPLGVYPAPTVDVGPTLAGPEFCATSIAPLRQLAAYLNRVFEAMNQTLVYSARFQSAQRIWVVPVAARPAEVVGVFEGWEPRVEVDRPPSPAQAALSAVTDLQRWLEIGQDQVATLGRFAPRSVKNWREGMDPYAATVRRLFDLHALVSSLTQRMGVDGARLWLADASRIGVTRRDLLADDAGLRSVISEASSVLFEAPTVPPLHALDFEEELNVEVSPRPDLFSGPIRRSRRSS